VSAAGRDLPGMPSCSWTGSSSQLKGRSRIAFLRGRATPSSGLETQPREGSSPGTTGKAPGNSRDGGSGPATGWVLSPGCGRLRHTFTWPRVGLAATAAPSSGGPAPGQGESRAERSGRQRTGRRGLSLVVTHPRHHAASRQRRGWRAASSARAARRHNKAFVSTTLTQKVVLQSAGSAGKGLLRRAGLCAAAARPGTLLPSSTQTAGRGGDGCLAGPTLLRRGQTGNSTAGGCTPGPRQGASTAPRRGRSPPPSHLGLNRAGRVARLPPPPGMGSKSCRLLPKHFVSGPTRRGRGQQRCADPAFLPHHLFLGSRHSSGSFQRGFPQSSAPSQRCSLSRVCSRPGPKSGAGFGRRQQAPCLRPARHRASPR